LSYINYYKVKKFNKIELHDFNAQIDTNLI